MNISIKEESIKLRYLSRDDYDKGIIELLGQLTSIDKNKIPKDKFDQYVDELNSSNDRITKIIEYNDIVIGAATLIIEKKLIHNLGKVGHIEDVVVHNDYRGNGLGKLIIDQLTKTAKDVGCYKVILDCDPKNAPFYQKCGFTEKGVEMALYFN